MWYIDTATVMNFISEIVVGYYILNTLKVERALNGLLSNVNYHQQMENFIMLWLLSNSELQKHTTLHECSMFSHISQLNAWKETKTKDTAPSKYNSESSAQGHEYNRLRKCIKWKGINPTAWNFKCLRI
jgi:hypothetical protein